jgi:MFS family permease
MLVSLLPLFLANVLGVRTVTVGLIEGLAESTASLTKLISGSLSDTLHQRKRLAVLGYGLSAIAKPFLYLATSWRWVLGVRFADRIGKGIRTAPRDALLAGSAAPGHRGFAFGLHRAGDTLGAFTGLAIAGGIIWATQASSATLTRQAFQWVVLASVLPAFLAVLVLVIGARDVQVNNSSNATKNHRTRWHDLDRRYFGFLGIIVIFTLGNSADAFILLRAQERGLTILQVIGMSLTFNAVYAGLSGSLGTLSDRLGRVRLILGGWITYGLLYLGFATAQDGALIWVLFGLYGAYYAATEGTTRALIADLIPETQRGTAYGLYHAAIGFGALPASLIAGGLWQGLGGWKGFGAAAPFYFGSAMALLATVLLVIWQRRRA